MNTIIILIFVLVIVSVYFIVQYKSNFEKRLVYHTPRLLSPERQEYIKGAERYIKKASVVIGLFVSFPLMVVCAFLLADVGIPIIFLLLIFLIAIECLAIYLLYRILKRNIKNQQALLEQMSDSDFELLLKIRDNFSFPYKYDPPFVLCNNHLYIFLFHTIKEIDPTQIISVKWHSTKYGFLVRIKDPKAKITVFNISKSALPLFLQIVDSIQNSNSIIN
ncbi:hypothetical protein ABC973_10675 [Capnocytophaga sputigena]|uniref:hypothetical protein n=1 Tax=Capnocytophaga sputigena TaxID=1019 RepID=UPI0031F571EF